MFCQCLSWWKWTVWTSILPMLISEEPIQSLSDLRETEEQWDFSSTSIIKLCSIVDLIETWDEKTRFYFWRYLAVDCHKLGQFNSRVAKTFSRSPGQFKCITRKSRCHVSVTGFLRNHTESLEPRCRIIWKYSISVGTINFSKYCWG